jgi:hypothetical protein
METKSTSVRTSRRNTPKPVAPTPDASILAKVMAKYSADNGFGPHTFNVHWSVPKADGMDKRQPILIQTVDGPRAVPPTIMTIIGAAFGVTDFKSVASLSGKSAAWVSADAVKRMNLAGYVLTTRGKLTTADVAAQRGANRAVPASVAPATSYL